MMTLPRLQDFQNTVSGSSVPFFVLSQICAQDPILRDLIMGCREQYTVLIQ